MLLFLLACTGPGATPDKDSEEADADTDTDTDLDDSGDGPLTDDDGDGYYAEKDDCDDTNRNINPEANERCDGLDNNCDGSIDGSDALNREECLVDSDFDGYGNEAERPHAMCTCEEGFTLEPGDCDDTSADVYPGAIEDDCADTVDRNCDGKLPSEDADGDGYIGCEDCNDADDVIHPGATAACNDCDIATEIVDIAFSSDFSLTPDEFTYNGNVTNVDGQLLLTSGAVDEASTSLSGFSVASNAPFEVRFTATLCCGGTHGMALGMINSGYHESSTGAGGSGLGLAGLAGYGLTLDTHMDTANGDPSDGFLGLVSSTADDSVLEVLESVDGIDWSDGVARQVVLAWEPSLGGGADLIVHIDGVEMLATKVKPLFATMAFAFTASTGDPANELQAIDDVQIKYCD